MDRRAYLLVTGVSLALVVALLGTPLWDLWYYSTLRSSPGAYIPVAVVVAAPVPARPKHPATPATSRTEGALQASRPRAAIPLTVPAGPDPAWNDSDPPATTRIERHQGLASDAEAPETSDRPAAPSIDTPTEDSTAAQAAEIPTAGSTTWYTLRGESLPAQDHLRQPPQDSSPGGSSPSSRIMPPPSIPGDPDPTPLPQPAVRLVPDRPDLLPGETVVVTVQVSGAVSMSSLPFHLRFDPEVLEFVGSQEGSALSGAYDPILLASVSPSRPGDLAVGLSLVESSGLFSGSGALVELRFRAVAPGESELDFDRASLRGPTSRPVQALFEKARIRVQ